MSNKTWDDMTEEEQLDEIEEAQNERNFHYELVENNLIDQDKKEQDEGQK